MRLCLFNDNRLGEVMGDHVRDISGALAVLPAHRYPFPTCDLLIANLDAVRDAAAGMKEAEFAIDRVRFHSPVANPGKLIGAPINYLSHQKEAEADATTFDPAQVRRVRDMGVFLKATSSLIGAGAKIAVGHADRRTDHEIELAVVIGGTANRVSGKDALAHVAGYSIGLDITLRGSEERSLRKSMDTYSVLGPWLVTADAFDPAAVDMELRVDGVTRQKANTRDLLLDVADLIEFASSFYTLHPGDIIYTGTPDGVGPIVSGERIDASIDGIGILSINVTAR